MLVKIRSPYYLPLMPDVIILLWVAAFVSSEVIPSFHFLTQNIFLTDNGTIKLGDFGSACILNRYREREATISTFLFQGNAHGFDLFAGTFGLWLLSVIVWQLKSLCSYICWDTILCGSRNLGQQALQQQEVCVTKFVWPLPPCYVTQDQMKTNWNLNVFAPISMRWNWFIATGSITWIKKRIHRAL